MLIDCDRCTMRDIACGDCVVTALLHAPGEELEVDECEEAALAALAGGGLVPRLRLSPVSPVRQRPMAG